MPTTPDGTIDLATPDVDGLAAAARALRTWTVEGGRWQLHYGDLGWFWRVGGDVAAPGVRTWSRDGQIVALGILDGPGLVRLAIAPAEQQDDELAERIAGDVGDPSRGVLPDRQVAVEAWAHDLLRDRLSADGWTSGEGWTPLRRDLAEPVPDPAIRIETVGPDTAHEWSAVVRGAFGSSAGDERWHAMAAAPPFAEARCLLGRDGDDAVAAVAVWSAGPGRPGLLEPMGVHPDHLGRGHGRAIVRAAAAALRALGSSSAVVAARSANTAGLATYTSAGFVAQPEVHDCERR